MHKAESFITVAVIVILSVAALIKITEMAFKYIVMVCGNAFERIVEVCSSIAMAVIGFFSLVPNIVWAAAMITLIAIGLIYIAIKAYHSLISSRNQAAIVEIKGFRAVINHNGHIQAVTFDGSPINTRQISSTPTLTHAEKQILQHMQRKIDEKNWGKIDQKSRAKIEDNRSKNYPDIII